MDPHLGQWLNLALRWSHVIVGIAWIGTSFYFNWLNSRLRAPERPEPGVDGELWSVHGGGFYRVVKYGVAPERLPRTLHWFKWEAYATWLTGFALLVLIYYMGADVFLVDPGVANIGTWAAIAIGVGALILGWLLYDALCKSPLGHRSAWVGTLGIVLTAAVAWGLTQLLSARAAYIHVGAMLGTIMAANVFRVIIPQQQHMVAALAAGRAPDAARGKQAALRSLHNNYLTLPVLFVMVSSHYPMTYGHAWSWAILLGIAVVGAGVRHWFNLRNQGHRSAWLLPAAAAALIALALVTRPGGSAGGSATVSAADVREIVERRCTSCHSATPTDSVFRIAPQGVTFDSLAQVRRHADRILAMAVQSHVMPPGNLTGMTEHERAQLGRWLRERAGN
jgi:uncharacterized membrane protein